MHPENLLEPWIALRLVLGLATTAILALAAWPSYTALRRFDVQRATEGQLLLERRFELASAAGRVGAVAMLSSVFVTVIAAGRIYPQIRGAMCPYGLFAAGNGFFALGLDFAAAALAGILLQVHRADADLPRLDLVRPLALGTLLLGVASVGSLVYSAQFWLGLDRSVVASCCSLELDATLVQESTRDLGAPWLTAAVTSILVGLAAVLAWFASRRPSVRRLTASGVSSALALPLAVLAVATVVAPHVFETPTHRCPFCLLRADAGYLGYVLFAAMLFAFTRALGVLVSVLVLPHAARPSLLSSAPRILRSSAVAWSLVLAAGAAPVLRYFATYDGRSLFP